MDLSTSATSDTYHGVAFKLACPRRSLDAEKTWLGKNNLLWSHKISVSSSVP